MRLVDTVIRSRNVGRQMAVVETWMEVRRLAFSSEAWPPISTSNRGETAIAKCPNSSLVLRFHQLTNDGLIISLAMG